MDTFENSFSELLEEEEEEKRLVASLTLWPTAASVPFTSRTFVFDQGPIVLGRASSGIANFLTIRRSPDLMQLCLLPQAAQYERDLSEQ